MQPQRRLAGRRVGVDHRVRPGVRIEVDQDGCLGVARDHPAALHHRHGVEAALAISPPPPVEEEDRALNTTTEFPALSWRDDRRVVRVRCLYVIRGPDGAGPSVTVT
jgi:hypothetical protein